MHAVEGVSFDVPAGSVVSLIGPNGAGKTTVLNSISGFVSARGSIRFKGTELLKTAPYRRAPLGIGRTFQNLQLFGGMTLLENVLVGQHIGMGGNLLFDVLRFPIADRERQARERAMEILARLHLEGYAGRRVEGLPFGVQKLAGVARALAVQPDLLLLDEPAAGLNHQEFSGLGELIRSLRDELGLAILLVEHNMRLVMSISDRVVALDRGRKLMEGDPTEVRQNQVVIEAYLGAASERVMAVEEPRAEGP